MQIYGLWIRTSHHLCWCEADPRGNGEGWNSTPITLPVLKRTLDRKRGTFPFKMRYSLPRIPQSLLHFLPTPLSLDLTSKFPLPGRHQGYPYIPLSWPESRKFLSLPLRSEIVVNKKPPQLFLGKKESNPNTTSHTGGQESGVFSELSQFWPQWFCLQSCHAEAGGSVQGTTGEVARDPSWWALEVVCQGFCNLVIWSLGDHSQTCILDGSLGQYCED